MHIHDELELSLLFIGRQILIICMFGPDVFAYKISLISDKLLLVRRVFIIIIIILLLL